MHTPGVKTIGQLCKFLNIVADRTLKSVVLEGENGKPVLLLLRGDHELNVVKAGKLDFVAKPVRLRPRPISRPRSAPMPDR